MNNIKVSDEVMVKTFNGKIWDARVLRVNTKTIIARILNNEWKGSPVISRRISRDIVKKSTESLFQGD